MINNLLVSFITSRLSVHPMCLKIFSLHGVKPCTWLSSCSLQLPARVSSLGRLTMVIKDLGSRICSFNYLFHQFPSDVMKQKQVSKSRGGEVMQSTSLLVFKAWLDKPQITCSDLKADPALGRSLCQWSLGLPFTLN